MGRGNLLVKILAGVSLAFAPMISVSAGENTDEKASRCKACYLNNQREKCKEELLKLLEYSAGRKGDSNYMSQLQDVVLSTLEAQGAMDVMQKYLRHIGCGKKRGEK